MCVLLTASCGAHAAADGKMQALSPCQEVLSAVGQSVETRIMSARAFLCLVFLAMMPAGLGTDVVCFPLGEPRWEGWKAEGESAWGFALPHPLQ